MEKRIYLLNFLLWPKFCCPFYVHYIINLKNYNIKTFVFKLFQYSDRPWGTNYIPQIYVPNN